MHRSHCYCYYYTTLLVLCCVNVVKVSESSDDHPSEVAKLSKTSDDRRYSEDLVQGGCSNSISGGSKCSDDNVQNTCKNDFRCNDGNCISMSTLCDGKNDCLDNSDESGYCKERTCNSYQYKCASGKCIPQHFVCNGQQDCLDGSDEKFGFPESSPLPPPIVTIVSNSDDILYGNSTAPYLMYKESIRVKFVCEAPYPIEWIFNFENVAGSAEFEGGNILELADPDSARKNEDPGTTLYRNHLDVMYYEILAEGVFYCRSISHPCLQTMVTNEHHDQDAEKVQFTISEKTDRKLVSIFNPSFADSKSECDAIWYYEKVEDYVIWRCESSADANPSGNGKDDKPGKISFIKCRNANLCNNYFRNNRQAEHCVRPYVENVTCPDCEKINDFNRQGRIIECYHEDENYTSYTMQSFNGLGMETGQFIVHYDEDEDEYIKEPVIASNIYFDLAEVPPAELLHLVKFPNDVYYIGEELQIICRASAYYFQPIIDIALEFGDGVINLLEPGPEFREYKDHVNEHVTVFTIPLLNDTFGVEKIYCIASVLSTLELVNASGEINIQVPIGPILMHLRDNLSEDEATVTTISWTNETIEWQAGELQKQIYCNVTGKPVPKIGWFKDGNEISATIQRRNELWAFSQLNFSVIEDFTAGIYVCEAVNLASNNTKHFEVIVKASMNMAIIGGIAACCILIAILLIVGLILFRRRRRSRNQNVEQNEQKTKL